RIGGTDAFGQHVGNTHDLEDRTHRTTGDNTGTFGSRLDEDLGSTVHTSHRMMQGTVIQAYLDHATASFVHGLLHGNRHFTCLALTHANAAIAVTDHCQGSKAHDTAALNH